MTAQEFIKYIEGKIFKKENGCVYMNFSLPDDERRATLQTKDERGRLNSCFYYLEEEGGDLFISYMDKEYLISLLPNRRGFELFREDRSEVFTPAVEEPTPISDN